MLFKRKNPLGFGEKLKGFFLPARSYDRSFRYFIKRVLRLSATPHAIAAGVAAGVFTSFTPFMGFHILLACAICLVIGGNMIAAALGTAIGNPLTFPFIWASTLAVGRLLLGGELLVVDAPNLASQEFWAAGLSTIWQGYIKPMTVGSLPIGVPVAVIFYFLTRWAAANFQEHRRQKIDNKAKQREGLKRSATHGLVV